MKLKPWTRFCGVTVASLALLTAACSDQSLVQPEAARAPSPSPLFSHVASPGNHIVVLAAASAPSAALAAEIQAAGGAITHQHDELGVLDVSGLTDAAALTLAARADIEGIDRDFQVQWIPSDEELTAQAHGAYYYGIGYQWNMSVSGADLTWHTTAEGAGTRVAILDTGIDPNHPDLAGRYDLANSVSVLSPGSSACNAVVGLPDEETYYDFRFHGTFVSGIVSSNGLGVASVAPGATLIGVKVLTCTGGGSFGDLIDGIAHATDVGADVINMSLGGYFSKDLPGAKELVKAVQRAVDDAHKKGVLLVAASGNGGLNLDEDTKDMIHIPSQLKHVLSVGATGPINQTDFDQLAGYSNHGKKGADMVAPGGNRTAGGVTPDGITSPCSSYSYFYPICGTGAYYLLGGNGTSYASPMVAGAAAVVEGETPGDSKGKDLEKCILRGVDDLGDKGTDAIYGAGRLNVPDAITCKSKKSNKSDKSDKSDKSGKSEKSKTGGE